MLIKVQDEDVLRVCGQVPTAREIKIIKVILKKEIQIQMKI